MNECAQIVQFFFLLKEQQQKGNKKKQIDSNQEHIQKKMSTLNDDVIKKTDGIRGEECRRQ